jgi:trehalose 6-phosphate phosphatase
MTVPQPAIPHLLRNWPDVAARLRARRRAIVFLDFDGTLVEIASRPNRVRMKPAMRRVLQRLAKNRKVTLAVISGRRREELRRCVGIPKIQYLGLYGWEIEKRNVLPASARVALFRAHVLLLKELSAFPGVWIEPKRNSFSIHLLSAKRSVQRRARQAARRFLRSFGTTLQLLENLRDIEVMPGHIEDKGAAVRKFLAAPTARGALAFFFGDDLSDEPAFVALRRGVSVLVGKPRTTRARFRLRGPDEVAIALARLEETLE